MDAPSWTPFRPDFPEYASNQPDFDAQPYDSALGEQAPIYRRPVSQVNHHLTSGPAQNNTCDTFSIASRGNGTWTSDFDPFDYEIQGTASVGSFSSTGDSFFLWDLGAAYHTFSRSTQATGPGNSSVCLGFAPTITPESQSTMSSSIVKDPSAHAQDTITVANGAPSSTSFITAAGRNLSETVKPGRERGEGTSPSQTNDIVCEYSGCTVKFGRKKDRNRHFRLKHQANEGFRCPLVDCSMGTGHKIQRRDKLREHLRRKADIVSAWQCILPGCTVLANSRSDLIDHLGSHDRITRLSHQQRLIDYSFISGDIHPGNYYNKPPLGYLTCEYICQIQGCPFGTNSEEVMGIHASAPHEGPMCPCPMSGCHHIFQDWPSTSAHLARNHDAADRKAYDRELADQGFWWRNSVFTCPICKVEIKVLLNRVSCDEKIRHHCSTHNVNLLKLYENDLVQAFARSNRRILWHARMPLLDRASDEQVFAYLTWPKERLLEIWGMPGTTLF